MPSRNHLVSVSRQLRERLNGRAFLTVARMEITQLVRQASGEEGTRIKSGMALDLERALLEQGMRCFPPLGETSSSDTVRLVRTPSVLGNLIDLLVYPSNEADKDLADVLTKIKGKWKWATPTEGPTSAA